VRAGAALTLRAACAAVAACVLFAPALRADTASVQRTLAQCLKQVEPKVAPGLENISPACPDLEKELTESGIANQLGENWQARLGWRGLKDLDWLTRRYQSQVPGVGPRRDSLSGIVKELRADSENHSWWQRVKEWLRQLLESRDFSSAGWLQRLLSGLAHMPKAVGWLLFYGGIAVILAMALVLVWREVSIAMADTKRARPIRVHTEPMAASAASLSLSDLDAVSLLDRPVLLLRLLVQALVASGRLTRERSLTCGELIHRADFDGANQQQRFARISLLAEQRRYAAAESLRGEKVSSEIESAVADGKQLYSQLAAPRSTIV
jgi:hypothetical protein